MSIVKIVNFEDGTAVDPVDWNALQKRLQAQLFDGFFGAKIREVETSTPSGSAKRIYTWGPGGGISAGGGALQSSNRTGWIAQLPDPTVDPTGEDARTLVYFLTQGELLSTHDAAHATLDRIDLICLKLEQVVGNSTARDYEDAATREPTSQVTDIERTVTLTKQVVKGSNATAGTAVEPAVPAGFAKYAAVKVPATFATTFDDAKLRDHRVPIGQYDVGFSIPSAAFLQGFARNNSHFQGGVVAANSGDFCFVPIPCAPKQGRIMRLHFKAKITAGAGAIILARTDMGGGADGATIYSFGDTGGANLEYDIISTGAIVDNTATAVATLGPVWGSGYESVEAGLVNGTHTCVWLCFTAGATGDIVESVRWEVAGS